MLFRHKKEQKEKEREKGIYKEIQCKSIAFDSSSSKSEMCRQRETLLILLFKNFRRIINNQSISQTSIRENNMSFIHVEEFSLKMQKTLSCQNRDSRALHRTSQSLEEGIPCKVC